MLQNGRKHAALTSTTSLRYQSSDRQAPTCAPVGPAASSARLSSIPGQASVCLVEHENRCVRSVEAPRILVEAFLARHSIERYHRWPLIL